MKTTILKPQVRGEISELFHDSRFWAVLAIIAFIVMFTVLVVWAAQSTATGGYEVDPMRYYYLPYGPGPYP